MNSDIKLSVAHLLSLVFFGLGAAVATYWIYTSLEGSLKKGSSGYVTWMHEIMDKMFMKVTRRKCTVIIIGSAFSLGLLAFYFTFEYPTFANVLVTFIMFSIGYYLPRVVLLFKYKKRLEKFDSQLIDALTLMSNSMRSGLNLNQAINVVVNELANPCSQEFGLVLSEHNLGLTLDEALERMMHRVPTEDLTMVVNSILILREKGGDITETFDVISTTVRERRKVEGKIKTITAQGKMQSLLLFLMPFGTGIVMYFLNPENMKTMLTTGTGWVIIGIMLVMQLIGGLWLRKIVDIKV